METFVADTVFISLDTEKVVTGFTTMRVKYKKPSGAVGFWPAEEHPSRSDTIRTTTRVTCDENGVWEVQAYIADVDEVYHGDFAQFKVFAPLL